jgi:hypothetical protein
MRNIADVATTHEQWPFRGMSVADARFEAGALRIGGRAEPLAEVLARSAPRGLQAEGSIARGQEYDDYSQHAFGAHFAEVCRRRRQRVRRLRTPSTTPLACASVRFRSCSTSCCLEWRCLPYRHESEPTPALYCACISGSVRRPRRMESGDDELEHRNAAGNWMGSHVREMCQAVPVLCLNEVLLAPRYGPRNLLPRRPGGGEVPELQPVRTCQQADGHFLLISGDSR